MPGATPWLRIELPCVATLPLRMMAMLAVSAEVVMVPASAWMKAALTGRAMNAVSKVLGRVLAPISQGEPSGPTMTL